MRGCGLHIDRREISLLKKLEHVHLIKLYDVLYNEEKQKLYMVMEYCIGGLQDMVDNAEGSRLPEWQAHSYVLWPSRYRFLVSRRYIRMSCGPTPKRYPAGSIGRSERNATPANP
jgi:hypothetical protein